ncbi:MAG: AmmeMemoRadiSam system radical SAM enzyme [Nanoarchaeota archaeon]|nr:AmmeMemoRadiSam system radical SAM enzyme [Nanoarchaeota archaeon]
MYEAMYYESLKDGIVKCKLCPRNCVIKQEQSGFCKVRKNVDGKLYSLVFGRVAGGLAVYPVEKKPLFHFLPGSNTLSFGTVGCNLHCKHCQNWSTSQAAPGQVFERNISPEEIVDSAKKNQCKVIAYTYNEPTIFYEFMLETAKLARKEGLKNVIVSNGFINPEPLKNLCKFIDGANIDLKSFNKDFYTNNTSSQLEPVLETLKVLKENNVWLEITTLIIPGMNDNLDEIKNLALWIKDNLGKDVPLHLSAFHPDFELRNLPPTPITTLVNAFDIAKGVGLDNVFIGNILTYQYENSYCPNCKQLLIERIGFNVLQKNLLNGCCINCHEKIAGVFE